MNISDIITLQGIELKRITANEMAGACPECGGKDRFRVFLSKNRWWCRGCNKSGDAIDFLRDFRNKSFSEACQIVGETEKLSHCREKGCKSTPEPRKWQAVKKNEPAELYQRKAAEFIENTHKELLNQTDILQWLESNRGINLDTVKKVKLGWNKSDSFICRENWGLEAISNETGRSKKLYLPCGLTIPVFRNNKLFRVKIRKHKVKEGENRYLFIAGGTQIPLILGTGDIMLVVESELDGILLSQETTGVSCIAFGSCSNRPDVETVELLKKSSGILLSLDSDEAGAKAAFGWWKENFPESVLLPIPKKYGKDPSEAWKNKVSLQSWVNIGINKIKKNKSEEIGRAVNVRKSENEVKHEQAEKISTVSMLLDPETENFECLLEERLAILEYDANMSRADAEREARRMKIQVP